MKKFFFCLLLLALAFSAWSQRTSFILNNKLYTFSVSANGGSHVMWIYHMEKENEKIIVDSTAFGPLGDSLKEDFFKSSFCNVMRTIDTTLACNDSLVQKESSIVLLQYQSILEKQTQLAKQRIPISKIDSLTKLLEEEERSSAGKLRMSSECKLYYAQDIYAYENKIYRNYDSYRNAVQVKKNIKPASEKRSDKKDFNKKLDDATNDSETASKISDGSPSWINTFVPSAVKVVFRDHVIDRVIVEGWMATRNGSQLEIDKSKLYHFSNQYSIAVQNINEPIDRLFFVGNDSIHYYVMLNQLIHHEFDSEMNIGRRIADDETRLNIETPEKTVYKNTAFEYVSAIVFTDLFSLNSASPNSLIQTQGLFDVPFNLRNRRKRTFFPSFAMQINISKIDGSNRELTSSIAKQTNGDSVSFVNIFDLVRYNNINFVSRMGIISYEIPRANLHIGIDVGYRVFRTTVQVPDPLDTNHVNTIMPNIYTTSPDYTLKFLFRPDINLGVDVFLTFNHLRQKSYKKLHESFGDVGLYPQESTYQPSSGKLYEGIGIYKNRMMFQTEINVYSFTNTKKKQGGIFIKTSVSFLPSTGNVFPMLLFGYSSDVRRLIKW